MPYLGNPFIDLMAGKLSSLARFRTLSHLNLQLVSLRQVVRRHPETGRSNLLDGRTHGIAVLERLVPDFILSTLAGIALASYSIHRNSQRTVSLMRYGAE